MATTIELSDLEKRVLKMCYERKFNRITATDAERDAEMSLIDKASSYERVHGLIDERIDFTPDCNLLVWFYTKVNPEG